ELPDDILYVETRGIRPEKMNQQRGQSHRRQHESGERTAQTQFVSLFAANGRPRVGALRRFTVWSERRPDERALPIAGTGLAIIAGKCQQPTLYRNRSIADPTQPAIAPFSVGAPAMPRPIKIDVGLQLGTSADAASD